MKDKQKGFTLIELLVVITVIALMAAVALVVISKPRVRARDIKRINDLEALSKALELYQSNSTQYPSVGFGTCPSGSVINSGQANWNNQLGNLLSPYMSQAPRPPNGSTVPYTLASRCTRVSWNGQCYTTTNGYYLWTRLEIDDEQDAKDGGIRPDIYDKHGGAWTNAPGAC